MWRRGAGGSGIRNDVGRAGGGEGLRVGGAWGGEGGEAGGASRTTGGEMRNRDVKLTWTMKVQKVRELISEKMAVTCSDRCRPI